MKTTAMVVVFFRYYHISLSILAISIRTPLPPDVECNIIEFRSLFTDQDKKTFTVTTE